MNKLLAILLVFGLVLFGCPQSETVEEPVVQAEVETPPEPVEEEPMPPEEEVQEEAQENETAPLFDVETEERNGFVKLDEVGGENLYVMSIWDLNSPVEEDGTFTTTVSAEGSQAIFLLDGDNQTRATAVSLPEDDEVVFSAESTTITSLWLGGSLDQETAEREIQVIKGMDCYPEFYEYISFNLPTKSMDEIVKDAEYFSFVMGCVEEANNAWEASE